MHIIIILQLIKDNIINQFYCLLLSLKSLMSSRTETKPTFIYQQFSVGQFAIELSKELIQELNSRKSLHTQYENFKHKSKLIQKHFKILTNEDPETIIEVMESYTSNNYIFSYKIKGGQDLYLSTYNFDELSFEYLDQMFINYETSKLKEVQRMRAVNTAQETSKLNSKLKIPGFYRNTRKFFAERIKAFFIEQIESLDFQVQEKLKEELNQKFEQLILTSAEKWTQKQKQKDQKQDISKKSILTFLLYKFVKYCVKNLKDNNLKTFTKQDIIRLTQSAPVENPILKAIYKFKAFILEVMRDFEGEPNSNQIDIFNIVLVDQSFDQDKYVKIRALKQENSKKNQSVPKPNNNSTIEVESTQNDNFLQNGNDSHSDDVSQSISDDFSFQLSPENKLNIPVKVYQLNSFSQSNVDFVLSSDLNTNYEIVLTQEKPNDCHEFQCRNEDQNIDVGRGSQYYCTAFNPMLNIMVSQEETDRTFPQSQNSY